MSAAHWVITISAAVTVLASLATISISISTCQLLRRPTTPPPLKYVREIDGHRDELVSPDIRPVCVGGEPR